MEEKLSREEFHKELEEARNKVKEQVVKAFLDEYNLPRWRNISAIGRFKSVRRAIKRGHIDLFTGTVYPRRPFSNRKPTKGRKLNELKKSIYGQFKSRRKEEDVQ